MLQGNVFDKRGVKDLPLRLDFGDGHRPPSPTAILAFDQHISTGTDNFVDSGAAVRFDVAVVQRSNQFRDQLFNIAAHNLGTVVSPELFRSLIKQNDPVLAIDEHDTVNALLQGLDEDLREIVTVQHAGDLPIARK